MLALTLGACTTVEALAAAPPEWWETTELVGLALLEDLSAILVALVIPLW